ncbi:MAG: hypothetical protein IJ688_00840 [Treponema sp.]|uniref:hypothetical protein n=1 Tax=Treponema sp. TaxID=166 RepID=UPI0025F322FE|nr:hypothetical protein [Treponema sp.]MBQ8680853.1 hypothetical protein [Treponema sp.]MBR1637913.1 hypothetical protein [Treponema sp.]
MSDFDFSKVTCDNIKFIPQKSQAIKDLEKEYEKQSKYILDKINEKYYGSIMSDRIKLQRRQELMGLKRMFLDPISKKITELSLLEANPPMIQISVDIDLPISAT